MKVEHILSLTQTVILMGGLLVTIRQMIILSRQLNIMSNQMNLQHEWQRKNATFDYLNRYSSYLKDTNIKLQEKFKLLVQNREHGSYSKTSLEMNDDSTRAALYEVVYYFENLAIGINQGYFDEDIIKSSLINVVVSTYKCLSPYISIRREETNLRIASNFSSLATKWEAEISKHT